MINRNDHSKIDIFGARTHNLKNINISIPSHRLVVITGLSGSGKSSLAFDTIFLEGKRRYIDTFSSYIQFFLEKIERPNVDRITGLSPVIAIEQKSVRYNPRSTVGTVTEVYDYFRLLFARIGEAYSYISGEKMIKYTEDQLVDLIMKRYNGEKVYLLAPLVKNRKGHYRELFEKLKKKGFLHVRIDGEVKELINKLKIDRFKAHFIELVIDKLLITKEDIKRVKRSIHMTLCQSDGSIMVLELGSGRMSYLSSHLMCPSTGLSYQDPSPNHFSFNSPYGACPRCKGIGKIDEVSKDLIMPNCELSIYEGGIVPLGKYRNTVYFQQIEGILNKYKVNIHTPLKNIPQEGINRILQGTVDSSLNHSHLSDSEISSSIHFKGIYHYILVQKKQQSSTLASKWAQQFITVLQCPYCNGSRLNKESLHYRINGKTIADLTSMSIFKLFDWVNTVEVYLSYQQKQIAIEILKEIRVRIKFILDIGLDYLTLDRSFFSLSVGESQRIRLATQISSGLVNVLYILDEPSIGLHQRDNIRLINALKNLRDIGNSVVVVEHDKEIMMHSDHIIDLGPGAGKMGGEVVFSGSPKELLKANTITSSYLNGEKNIQILKRRIGNGKNIILTGVNGNNLKNIDVKFPLGKFICVTGVSGSGKSTLINDTLYPIVCQRLYCRSLKNPLSYCNIEGLEYIDKVVNVDQSPIGKTPRSNPATYTGVFADIRLFFSKLPESKIRGYTVGHFSSNSKEGACEACKGNGYKVIEMKFLPTVYTPCEYCQGKRYNQATLTVQFKGKSISDVLNMTIDQAAEFFQDFSFIYKKLQTLKEVGLGYVCLGQSSTSLSGGESQRLKISVELSKKSTGKTLYLFDEPTTGLHFEDIKILLNAVSRLVDKGNTIIVIEHNIDIIKSADYLIDLGPEGGINGGEIMFAGTPEQMIISNARGYTSQFLSKAMNV